MSPAPVSTTGVPGRSDVALTLQQQPAGDVRGPVGRIFGRDPVVPGARGAFGRATGARHVARLLDGLGPEWVAVHSVPLGGRSDDAGHVAVGPPGVLAVTSAHHRIKNVFVTGHEVFVNRENVPTMTVAEAAADRVQGAVRAASGVEVVVTPVIVFVDPKRLVVREKPERTRVFTDLLLRRRLRRLPPSLSGRDLDAVQAAVLADDTWAKPTMTLTAEQLERFDQLERSATTARRLRSAWRWAAAVVLLSATLLVVQAVALGIIG
jgi:hypothetical protein